MFFSLRQRFLIKNINCVVNNLQTPGLGSYLMRATASYSCEGLGQLECIKLLILTSMSRAGLEPPIAERNDLLNEKDNALINQATTDGFKENFTSLK